MSNQQQSQGLKQGHQSSEFPISQSQRGCTDVFCTIVGVLFTLVIVVVALIVFNNDHYMRTSFPSDSQGRLCGYDLKNHPYVYFTNFPIVRDRVCVQTCPQKDDQKLKCVPTENIGCIFSKNPNFTVTYYENTPEELEIGSFCVPTEESLKQNLYEDIDVTNRYNFFKQIKCIIICGAISLGLSILYLCFVQWLPKLMNLLTIILGLVFVGIMALFMIFYPTQNTAYKIIFAAIVILLMSIVAIGAFKSKACFDMHGVFLSAATQFVRQDLRMLAFIPIFLAIFILFVIIIVWELKSLWSSAAISFSPDEVYYEFQSGSTTFLTVLIMIQFIWGLSFIKQSFNFCISGNAVEWYLKQANVSANPWTIFKPLRFLCKYHFGSVVAGSFINVTFSLFDYIFDVLRADTNSSSPRHSCLSALDSLFDLVRSDSMAYINITGNPYCNSSRYCEWLCRRSPIAESYRICSHFLLAGFVATISFFLQGGAASIFIVLVVFILSLFLSTFFISLHADAAEAIQVIFLVDYKFAKQNEKDKNRHSLSKLRLRNPAFAQEYHKESQKMKIKINEQLQDREDREDRED